MGSAKFEESAADVKNLKALPNNDELLEVIQVFKCSIVYLDWILSDALLSTYLRPLLQSDP